MFLRALADSGSQGAGKQDAAAFPQPGWQQVALQFKGIAVEGLHITSLRDAPRGVARHWEQEGPAEGKKKKSIFPL